MPILFLTFMILLFLCFPMHSSKKKLITAACRTPCFPSYSRLAQYSAWISKSEHTQHHNIVLTFL